MIKKGMTIHFISSDRKEIVLSGSRDPVDGMIKTTNETYSYDFINRWAKSGFLKIYDKNNKEVII